MKKFHFPLQRTMDWRGHQTEQQKAELERLQGHQKSLSEARSEAQKDLEALGRQTTQNVVIAAEQLHQMASFGQSLANLEKHLRSEQDRCEAQIEQQKRKCQESDRNYQLLVRLHDGQKREWEYELNRELDQTATEIWSSGQSIARTRGRKSEDYSS